MSSQYSVPVSIEITDEYAVQEVTYDGQEKYQSPLTMSENLARMVQRIDFNSIESDEDTEGTSDNKEAAALTAPQWPWESARNKIRSTLTEIHVLEDVLNIAKEKKYLVLDPVVSQDSVEMKPIVSLVAKKKAFGAASAIIMSGVERIRQSKNDTSRSQTSDFHSELMLMRQSWRLRRAGNSIIGDLSYRSAGSWYPHPGNFEVTKNEDAPKPPSSPSSSGQTGSSPTRSGPKQSALKVKIPSDLEGVAYIHVCVQEDRKELDDDPIKPAISQEALSKIELTWQQKLENAQNVLFCKELFAKLAQEAVQVQFPIPTIVNGNVIIATLFPGIQLNIGLVHSTPPKKKRKLGKFENSEITEKNSEPVKFPHKPVLEHTLHQLLKEIHYNALHHPMPHPTTATLGLSRLRYFAGPEAYDRHILTESCKNETMLEQIISQAQHLVLRDQVLKTIDDLAKEIKEAVLIVHCLCLNSPTRSCIKIFIVSSGYESLNRTSLTIHISPKSMTVICREGKKYTLHYDVALLRETILSILSHHHLATIQALCKLMGWRCNSFTNNCGIGPVEQIGTAGSLLIASPNDERVISVRHGPTSGADVAVSTNPRDQDFYPSSIIRDRKWQNIQSNFKSIDLSKMQGRNLINKIEILMSFAKA